MNIVVLRAYNSLTISLTIINAKFKKNSNGFFRKYTILAPLVTWPKSSR